VILVVSAAPRECPTTHKGSVCHVHERSQGRCDSYCDDNSRCHTHYLWVCLQGSVDEISI